MKMNEKEQKQEFDRRLFEKLLRARSETTISAQEAKRLAEVFASYQKRYPIAFGNMQKINRRWVL
jgi:hypothetical protein